MTESSHILYTIGCFRRINTGIGGHYHSLRTLAEAYAGHRPDVRITVHSFGDSAPDALTDLQLPYKHEFVKFSDILSFSTRDIAPDTMSTLTHIHAFDRRSLFFSRRLARQSGLKIYLTKPGGPTTRYMPTVPDTVFFSRENIDAAILSGHSQRSNLHYIPQRVKPVPADHQRIQILRQRIAPSKRVILRIARIGTSYIQSIRQTIALAAELRSAGIDALALIIGVPEDSATLKEIELLAYSNDLVITDPYFTHRAAALITIADIVVGTGRSLMEAAMAGVPVLAPIAGATLPELITDANVDVIQRMNFSERLHLPTADPAHTLSQVTRALTDVDHYNTLRDMSTAFALRLFDVSGALSTYDRLYRAAQTPRYRLIDDVLLGLDVARCLAPRRIR